MLKPVSLQVEYKNNPIGMDEITPRFFYRLEGNGGEQLARRLTVALADGMPVWDSGWVDSGITIQIPYSGPALRPFTDYRWQVSVRDDRGDVSESAEARFETGFMGTPWQGKWISSHCASGDSLMHGVQQLFRDFEVPEDLVSARLYAAALGLYEARLNGENITEDIFAPGFTDYYERVQYQAYDITSQLRRGELNALSVNLADGWYCGQIARLWSQGNPTFGGFPCFIGELHLRRRNGETIVIATDEDFKSIYYGFAPLRHSDIYAGERAEAWRDDTTWRLPGTERSHVCPVTIAKPKVRITWQSGAPVRRMHEIKPKEIIRRPGNAWIIDFGQNFTGRERLRLTNTNHGVTIIIKHGEMLNEDGSLYTENLRSAAAQTIYSCGNHEEEIYEPAFTFYGFRYLEINGWPGEPTADQITAFACYSDLPETGTFSCSDPLLNQLYSNIVWGQRSNFFDIPTDCPQRDERLGWTGDTQVFANIATYNMYAPEFYTKWITDLNTALTDDGCFANFVPHPYHSGWRTQATGWSDAGIICPFVMFAKYGDTRLMEKYYDNMAHWLDWQIARSGGTGLVSAAHYRDWLNIDADTPEEYLSSTYLAGMLKLLGRIAGILGRPEEKAKREATAEAFTRTINEKYFPNGELTVRTQTAALLALHFDLVEGTTAARTVDFLVKDICENRQLHLSTGFLGTPLLLPVLTKVGQIDLAYKLLMQTTYPGWLYPVTQGATTMWERWNSWSDAEGFGDVDMNSFNHYAYGAVGEWFFETICGINPGGDADEERAFRRFRLAPQFGTVLQQASARYDSINGRIESAWTRQADGSIEWQFSVPCNTTATVTLPAGTALAAGELPAEFTPGTHTLRIVNN